MQIPRTGLLNFFAEVALVKLGAIGFMGKQLVDVRINRAAVGQDTSAATRGTVHVLRPVTILYL